jgi:hypothetical protein
MFDAFRRRPLTWLFWIATACADVVGILKHPDGDWLATLMFGQLYVVCGWAAVSRGRRLVRAGAVLAAPLLVSLVVLYSQRSPNEAPAELAATLILGGLVVLCTGALTIAWRALPGQPHGGEGNKFQISVLELLGWTVVTAVGSWLVTLAELPPLEYIWGLWSALFSPLPAAIMMAGFLAPRRRLDRTNVLLSIAAVTAFLFAAYRWDNHDADDLLNWAELFAFVALWVFVVRLDEAAELAGAHSGLSVEELRADHE